MQAQATDELYLKSHSLLDQIISEQQASFDKTLITLASGALGLSIAFAERVATEPIEAVRMLIAAWGLFGIALIAILISFLVSVYALRQAQEDIKHTYYPDKHSKPDKNWLAIWVVILNISSLIAFVSGVACIIIFAARNISP